MNRVQHPVASAASIAARRPTLKAWATASLPLILLMGLPASGTGESAGWPQWRGPSRDGQVGGLAWPESLSEASLTRQWEIPLGPSYSGPIVWEDRVFVTETVNEEFEGVSALDRQSGARLWQTRWPGAMKVPPYAARNGDWIRSTPTCDGERLFVAGMRDVLVCLDVATGEIRWRLDFMEKYGTELPSFGLVCSPLVADGAVFIQAGASVLRINALDGSISWRSMQDASDMSDSAFSSPIIAAIGGKRQLIVQARKELAGLDLNSGEVLWRKEIPADRQMNILTPVVHEDIVLTSAPGGRTLGHRLVREGSIFRLEEAWKHKAQGYMSTPVVIGHHSYHHLRSQRLMCLDLKTGVERWTTGRSFGKYCSLVAQRNRILALNETGELFLIRARPESFELIDTRRVSDSETWAHLAVAGDQLFVRSLNTVSAWRWSER